MTPEQLRYLIETIEKGSFVEAAKSIFCTPQAVAKGIGCLEKELGVKLFIRDGRNIYPTDIALETVNMSREILGSMLDLQNYVNIRNQALFDDDILRLGVEITPYRGSVLPDSVSKDWKAAHPDVKLTVVPCFGMDICEMLENGLIDAALTLSRKNSPLFFCNKVYKTKFFLVLSSTHPYASKRKIRIEDLASTMLAMPYFTHEVYSSLITELKRNKLNPPDFTPLCPFRSCHESFLYQGGGIITLPTSPLLEPNDSLTHIEISEEVRLWNSVHVVCRLDSEQRAASILHAFLQKYR